MRTIRLIVGFITQYFVQWFSKRGFLITIVIGQVITPLIGLAVWTSAVPNQNLSAYYIALIVVRLCAASYEPFIFSGRIYSGDLADDLLQPHPVIVRTLSENLAIRAWHVVFGLPLLMGALLLTQVQFDFANFVPALPALVFAAVLNFLFSYALALTAFWIEKARGVAGIGTTLTFLLGGEAVPIRLLPEVIRPLGEVCLSAPCLAFRQRLPPAR